MKRTLLALGISVIAAAAPRAALADRMLRTEMVIDAPVEKVWKAWTTEEGIASFFAPGGHVDLRVDGTYDIWFNPKAEPGERGADGMRILGLEPMKRFAFTWNAPPSIPTIREQRTMVILDFAPLGADSTEFRFTQIGWGEGPDWDKAYEYFQHAWGAVVLPRLAHRFEKGPIDWNAPPELAPIEWEPSAWSE